MFGLLRKYKSGKSGKSYPRKLMAPLIFLPLHIPEVQHNLINSISLSMPVILIQGVEHVSICYVEDYSS